MLMLNDRVSMVYGVHVCDNVDDKRQSKYGVHVTMLMLNESKYGVHVTMLMLNDRVSMVYM